MQLKRSLIKQLSFCRKCQCFQKVAWPECFVLTNQLRHQLFPVDLLNTNTKESKQVQVCVAEDCGVLWRTQGSNLGYTSAICQTAARCPEITSSSPHRQLKTSSGKDLESLRSYLPSGRNYQTLPVWSGVWLPAAWWITLMFLLPDANTSWCTRSWY